MPSKLYRGQYYITSSQLCKQKDIFGNNIFILDFGPSNYFVKEKCMCNKIELEHVVDTCKMSRKENHN